MKQLDAARLAVFSTLCIPVLAALVAQAGESNFGLPRVLLRKWVSARAYNRQGPLPLETRPRTLKLCEAPGHVTRPPLLGEHTTEVLTARGFTVEELARLRETRAIG